MASNTGAAVPEGAIRYASLTSKAWYRKAITVEFPETEHIHFYGFYIGNFPDLRDEAVDKICAILNAVE